MDKVITVRIRDINCGFPIIVTTWELAEHVAQQIGAKHNFVPQMKIMLTTESGLKAVAYEGYICGTMETSVIELVEGFIVGLDQDNLYYNAGDTLFSYDLPEDKIIYEDWTRDNKSRDTLESAD